MCDAVLSITVHVKLYNVCKGMQVLCNNVWIFILLVRVCGYFECVCVCVCVYECV